VILASATNCDGRTSGMFLRAPRASIAAGGSLHAGGGRARARQLRGSARHWHPAGDPVECEALGKVLGARRASRSWWLGENQPRTPGGGAGVAGIMKVILALEHREFREFAFETPNPRIPFAERNLQVVTQRTSLAAHPAPLVMA